MTAKQKDKLKTRAEQLIKSAVEDIRFGASDLTREEYDKLVDLLDTVRIELHWKA